MPIEDYENLTDADFEDLPPLVPAGEDREKILAEVIEHWATQTADLFNESGRYTANFETLENHPATLKRLDLRDDNPDAEPVDLGRDLLQPLTARLTDLGNATPPPTAITLLGCHVQKIHAGELEIYSRFSVIGTRFDRDADFDKATFNANAYFREATFNTNVYFHEATFNAYTDFCEATFNADADFRETKFNLYAYFHDTTFDAYTDFRDATFNADADFRDATFDTYTDFRKAAFNTDADFRDATFNTDADFRDATFNSYADFRETKFNADADFYAAKFNADADFRETKFNADADFRETKFNADADFRETKFNADADFIKSDLRRARVESSTVPLRTFITARRQILTFTDAVEWRIVRSIGELTALTRVSYFALAGVPLLAGLWGPARGWIAHQSGAIETSAKKYKDLIEKHGPETPPAEALREVVDSLGRSTLPETLPLGWLLAFLAAFAVVLGQLIYQIAAPELIRQSSEDELVEAANERSRTDGEINPERLKQAVSRLKAAADAMPHRHNRWFVKRSHGTVWIPDNVEEHFEDAEIEESRPDWIPEDEWEPTTEPAIDQEVSADERKRIAIEEGEKARYAIAAYTNREAAWLSGGLYLMAGWLLLVIVLRQLGHIAEASPAPWLAFLPRVLTQGVFVTAVAVGILIFTGLGVLLVLEGGFAKWVETRLDAHEKAVAWIGGVIAKWWVRVLIVGLGFCGLVLQYVLRGT